MEEAKNVNINIRETFSIDKDSKLLLFLGFGFVIFFILTFFLLFAYYYDTRTYYSPVEDIFTFVESINDSNSVNLIVGENAKKDEINEIENFLYYRTSNFSAVKEVKDNSIIVGTKISFTDLDNMPYSNLLLENNSIVIFDAKTNSLYIYAKDYYSLKITLKLLNENIGMFGYNAVNVNGDNVEEIILG